MSSSIGLMEGAYFVGRKEVLDFINNTLELNLAKVEDTASGAVACQLLDIMYPNTIPMNKVNWSAAQAYEFVGNYKILQTAFTKLHIDRHVDVDRLIKGLYMDNLEFMQWFKRFFEMQVSDKGAYDCQGQRTRGKGGAAYNAAHGGKGGSSTASSKIAAAGARSSVPKRTPAAAPAAKEKSAPPPPPATKTAPAAAPAAPPAAPASSGPDAVSVAKIAALNTELDALRVSNDESNRTYTELRQEMDGLEKERDFYFDKLRDIEILLQDVEDSGKGNELTASIFKILYATAEGFEQAASDAAAAAAAADSAAAAEKPVEGEGETL